MSFIEQFPQNITFSKEFVENGIPYIYSIYFNSRISSYFSIIKTGRDGTVIWSKNYSDATIADQYFEIVQIEPMAEKDEDNFASQDNLNQQAENFDTAFYGQYVIIPKSSSKENLHLLVINSDGTINASTSSLQHINPGVHDQKMVSDGNYCIILSTEVDSITGAEFQKLLIVSTGNNSSNLLNLKGLIYANDLAIVDNIIYLVGNHSNLAALVALDAWSGSVIQSYTSNIEESLVDIEKIENSSSGRLSIKLRLGDGRYAIGLNRVEDSLSLNPASLTASFDYIIVGNDISAFCITPEEIYFTQECYIYKSNYLLNIVWKKKIDIEGREDLLISKISYNNTSNFLTATIVNTSPLSDYTSYLVYMDRDASTCKTISQNIDSFVKLFASYTRYYAASPVQYSIIVLRHSFSVSDINFPFVNICGSSIDEDAILQSSALYLQAAGSTGEDSTSGIHLRWLLKGPLANHLPKGNYYDSSQKGLNKANDFVKILKTPYVPVVTNLNLSVAPNATVDNEALWLYQINGKTFYVNFKNLIRYQQVRTSIDPAINPLGFLQEYSDNLIEIEIKDYLFFASKLYAVGEGNVKTEVLSVETNEINLPKHTAYRQNTAHDNLSKIFVENGRSIRFAAYNCIITAIDFEFYSDFVLQANRSNNWRDVGSYSLSTNDQKVYDLLDPDPQNHPVHAKWPRYNDGEYVNVNNYKTKWNGNIDDPRNLIKHSVEQYLLISDDPTNPLATETYFLENNDGEVIDEDNFLVVSHLTILQIAAFDYHVARMLGLGCLDFSDVFEGQQYIYVAQYITEEYLGEIVQNVTHLSVSLPTSINDKRATLPIVLKEPFYGILSTDSTSGNPQTLTDPEGYTYDKRARYVSLLIKELTPDEPADAPFYFSSQEFNMSQFTYPVYVGIEYKEDGELNWRKPELPNDSSYQNVNSAGNLSNNETIAIALPELGQPAFVHRETKSGTYVYGSYGVNWFSRAKSNLQTLTVTTDIKPANRLLPPSNINTILIQNESPLLFTSAIEQETLEAIQNPDKTFIRLSFDYDFAQDMISYQKEINGVEVQDFDPLDDEKEIFADEINVLFRPEIPKQVIGSIASVSDLPGNPLVSVIQSQGFVLYSTGDPNAPSPGTHQTIYPKIAAQEADHFKGGILTAGANEFIIHDIIIGLDDNTPLFHVFKKNVGSAFEQNGSVPFDPSNFIAPEINQSFVIVENMQNEVSWGQLNPYPVKILIGAEWDINSELVTLKSGQGEDITYNTFLRKFRGIYKSAKIRKVEPDAFEGLYEITFERYTLASHPQYSINPEEFSVQWSRGTIRIPKDSDQEGERKTLKVIKIDNIDFGDLILQAVDETFATDPLFTRPPSVDPIGSYWQRKVNFYPGYRVYFYSDEDFRLTYNNIYSQEEAVLEKYSIFGLQSVDRRIDEDDFVSRISKPNLMFSRRIEEPQIPDTPTGSKYATRPDYYGRSTYAFATSYTHKPFSVTFLRTNDDILLSSLFKQTPYGAETELDSVEDIRIKNNDPFFNDRLLGLANVTVIHNQFELFNGYRLPMPNNLEFFANINSFIDDHNKFFNKTVPFISPSEVTNMAYIVIPADPLGKYGELTFYHFVKQTIQNTYVPLTEIPVIYQYIKTGDYTPIAKAQVIRDRNGNLLSPSSVDFDMAPMIKVLETEPGVYKTLFVDFTLDGNSKSVYFYTVKETNSEMKQSDLSYPLGPVKLVNSYPVKTPEIKSVIPVLENQVLNILPEMELKINSYDPIYNIKKAKLYRALTMTDALSVRSMVLIKDVNLESAGIINDSVWTIEDDFSDLTEVPFSDPLFYRITVEREIEYAEPNFDGQEDVIVKDYAPSEMSKLMVTTITENVLPKSPELSYTGTLNTDMDLLTNVILTWSKACYKAKYHLYKMNSQGNWVKIADVQSNDAMLSLHLSDTDWGSSELQLIDIDGKQIYHHFKMISENTAGMMSTEEKRLTLITANLGISSNGTDGMIIGTTFLIR